MKNNNLCIVQARMGSTRLPGKVLMKVGNVSLLEYQVKRLRLAKKIDKIVIATSVDKKNDQIRELCKKIGIECFRGSEDDVLDRYYQCSLKYHQYDNILRVTGDCPLIDPAVIDQVVSLFEEGDYDYASNVVKETFPDGMDVEIFKRSVLHEAAQKAELPSDREGVNEYILRGKKYKKGNLLAASDWSHFRLTVDEKEDFEVVKFLIKNCKMADDFLKYISALTKHPEIMLKNRHIKRNEGMLKTLEKDKIFLKAKN
jgi:spore coat polysaccharide biosynthesis protein SpsF (cytidylyltransferase family)